MSVDMDILDGRYLVDDRDGIWTVKQGIIEEVQKGITPKPGTGWMASRHILKDWMQC